MQDNENMFQQNQALSSSNESYINASIIQLRLNTETLLKDIELYLIGSYESTQYDEKGVAYTQIINVSEPQANPIGIYSIMSWLRSTINSQVVQGNIEDFSSLYEEVANFRMDLVQNMMINLYDWGIKEYAFEGIVDRIMKTVKPFLSRLVKNKERESYDRTLSHSERSEAVRSGKKSFPFMN